MSLALDRQIERWYPLIDHPVQLELMVAVSNGVRFPVVPAGRRSGKTERFKRFIAKLGMTRPNEKYFIGAPTRDQVKKIYWDDMKKLTLSSSHSKKPSESDLIIFMPNGTEIHLIGLDNPARIEGIQWTGGGIDEIADLKQGAWEAHILPALNTVNPTRPNYRAFCWLLGVPDGLNHFYEMAQYAEDANDPLWAIFHWKSSEILPEDVIQSAKTVMSEKQFKQEFEASFETASGRIYEDYSNANATDVVIEPHESLLWMHDQNYTPLSSAIAVKRGNDYYLLDEIVLESAVSEQSAIEFIDKFKDHQNKKVYIYGDPAGRAGEKHGQASAYTQIEDVLKNNGWTFERRVKKKHPAIKDRQNSVRALIRSADGKRRLYVNHKTAPWCHKALSTVQLKKGSTFIEDDSNQYQHISTAIGYFVDYEEPVEQQIIMTGIGSAV